MRLTEHLATLDAVALKKITGTTNVAANTRYTLTLSPSQFLRDASGTEVEPALLHAWPVQPDSDVAPITGGVVKYTFTPAAGFIPPATPPAAASMTVTVKFSAANQPFELVLG